MQPFSGSRTCKVEDAWKTSKTFVTVVKNEEHAMVLE